MVASPTLFDVDPFVVDPEAGIRAELGKAMATQRAFIDAELRDAPKHDWDEDYGWTTTLPVVVCIAGVALAEEEIRLRGGVVPTSFDDHHETLIGRLNQEGPDSPFVLNVDGPPFNDIAGYCPELVDAALERAVAIGRGACAELIGKET